MEDYELKQLEYLLEKMRVYIGHPYFVVPCYLQDGFLVGVEKRGEEMHPFMSHDLKGCMNKIKANLQNKKV